MKSLPKEYLLLFNTVSDAEAALYQLRETLLEAQRRAEELFLCSEPEGPGRSA